MSKLPRTTYRIDLEGRDDVVELTPILADILRGELEGPRHGITSPTTHSVHTTVLWLWSAALRAGEYDGDFQTFKNALLNFEAVKTTDVEVQGVPPTLPSVPPSDSPPDTGTPTTPEHGSGSSTALGRKGRRTSPRPRSTPSSVTDDQTVIPGED